MGKHTEMVKDAAARNRSAAARDLKSESAWSGFALRRLHQVEDSFV